MPKKRKNGGKNRHNRGRVGFVRCDVSGRAVPKDKAIKRFIVRNLVDASGQKDINDKRYYNRGVIPKMYYKAYYCVSAAIHQRIVRPRNRDERKNRNPPPEVLKRWAAQAKKQREIEAQQLSGGRGRGGGFRGGGRGGGISRNTGTGPYGRGGRGGSYTETRGGGRGGYIRGQGYNAGDGDNEARRANQYDQRQPRGVGRGFANRPTNPRTNFRGGRGGGRGGARGGRGGGRGGRGGGAGPRT